MKEYIVLKISKYAENTEHNLNKLAKDGWKLICSYAYRNEHLILERDTFSKGDKNER